MKTAKPRKLYAYVDESGQDTLGDLFVVATVLTGENSESVRQSLERLERASGKGLRKWMKSTPRQRLAYITAVLRLPAFHGQLFVAHFTKTTTYLPCVLTTITRAMTEEAAGQPCHATVFIDGLQTTIRQEVAAALRAQFRSSSMRLEKVRGLDDQSDALMRLADAIAGFARHALEGRPALTPLFTDSRKRGIIRLLQT